VKKIDTNYKTIVPNKLFKLAESLGPAVWFYLWCVARTTKEIVYDNDPTRYGSVLGGMPVSSETLRTDLDFSRGTLEEWRKRCVKAQLVRTKRAPVGYIIEVINSVKFPDCVPDERTVWEKPHITDAQKTKHHLSDAQKTPHHSDAHDSRI
jgi:hypothetical protein